MQVGTETYIAVKSFNSLFEMPTTPGPPPVSAPSFARESGFNSLFEMRLRTSCQHNLESLERFNSLFEMRASRKATVDAWL